MKFPFDMSLFSPEQAIHQTKHYIEEVVNRTLDRSIRLAVTGLSQSGKSTFISSLVHQLQHRSQTEDENTFFYRILGCRQVEQGDPAIKTFPYRESLRCLGGEPPTWPPSTTGMSELRLAVRYAPTGFWHRQLKESATLYLDIVDYPGEWLLDLPMLNLSYGQWSQQMAQLCRLQPRLQLSKDFRQRLDNFFALADADDGQLEDLSRYFTEFLLDCRQSKWGLSIIQPGRFVLPGELSGAPALSFFPLLDIDKFTAKERSKAGKGSALAVLERRFEYYKEHVIRRFYRRFFSGFDRQIVLIDCLKSLNTGYDSFRDMQEALQMLVGSFRYGRHGFLGRLLRPSIDKVLFAATKADHVTPNQHHNLELFVQKLVSGPRNEIGFEDIKTKCMALAAVKATTSAQARFQGQQISCLKGKRKGSHEEVALFPGEVPTSIPSPRDWDTDRFQFIDFSPPPLHDIYSRPLPQIHMEQALEFLLADKLD